MVVDYEPATVLLFETFLADTTTEIRGVTDSRKAERALNDFESDIVLLDLDMRDGYQNDQVIIAAVWDLTATVPV